MRERARVSLATTIQAGLGRWAEPLAARIARPILNDLSGHRSVTRVGLRWELDMRHNIDRRLYAIGSYESATIREARRFLGPGDTVLDVGANIGTFSLPLARAGFGVVAVEPASDTGERLRRHIDMNGLTDQVRVEQLALGASDGSIHLRAGRSADVGLRTTTGTSDIIETVRVRRGDQLVSDLGMRPALVKVDVEGGELDVVRGLTSTLPSVRVVIVELVDAHQQRRGSSAQELVHLLSSAGFDAFAIRSRGVEPWTGQQGNVLFRRMSADPSSRVET